MTTPNQEATPDQLLEAFQGRSFKSIILFTIVVHLVIVVGSSVPYLVKSLGGKSDSKLTEVERTEIAAREATTALRDIAAKHGLKPQDLGNRIAGGAAPAAAKEETSVPTEDSVVPPPADTEPRSAIEEQLEVKEDGPTVPPVPTEEATDDDLFE